MLKEEYIEDGERVRHYSDEGFKIRQIETGVIYEDAVDVLPCRYTYEETDEPIEYGGNDATAEDYEAALKRLGVEV